MNVKNVIGSGSIIAFLDVIACGFGAIVLLVLILPVGNKQESEHSDTFAIISNLKKEDSEQLIFNRILQAKIASEILSIEALKDLKFLRKNQSDANRKSQFELREQLYASSEKAEAMEKKLLRKTLDTGTGISEKGVPSFLYGIAVDSDYLVFVIDTSGSMQSIWSKVVGKVADVLRNYPGLSGFQVLSDQGQFLYKDTQGWMTAADSEIEATIRKLDSWKPYSNSSPVEGIKVAVEKLYTPGLKMALFVAGDDYTGERTDSFLDEVARIKDRTGDASQLRIHALGFHNDLHSQYPERFARLMQILTFNNGGSFLFFGNEVADKLVINRGRKTPNKD